MKKRLNPIKDMKLFITSKRWGFLVLWCVILLQSFNASALTNTQVFGRVSNSTIKEKIKISVDHRYLNEDVSNYSVELNSDGSYAMSVELDDAQFVYFQYKDKQVLIYLEPNSSTEINFDGRNFENSLEFVSTHPDNNKVLHQYLKANPREVSSFRLIRYKKGTYWYTVTPEMDQKMQMLNPHSFTQHMKTRKDKAFAILDDYYLNHKEALSNDFRAYLSTEIYYDWAYHMMMYGHVYKVKHNITASYFEFMDEVPLQDDNLSNFWYGEYLKAHLSYAYEQKGTSDTPYAGQYEIAVTQITDRPLAYLHSELISKAFAKNKMSEILPKYSEYLRTTSYSEFDEKVVTAYEKATVNAAGTIAPIFTLTKVDGTEVNLSQYRGKVVYLNFWASWCRPCISKMDAMKFMQKDLSDRGVIFLNISLDKEKMTWLNSISSNQYKGVHVMANSNTSIDVKEMFQVSALPSYFIIGKDGSFLPKPQKNDLTSLRETLQAYLSEN